MKLSLICFLVLIIGQNAFGRIKLSNNVFNDVPYSSQYSEDGSLIRSVDFRSVNDLIPRLERKYKKLLKGRKLQHRNESHITVIRPPEGKTDFMGRGNVGIDKVFQLQS